ncbi:MAG: glycosyltransferase [Bacteroidota bacterium]
MKTILVIDDYVPYHDKSSGSKRLYEIIKLLRVLGLKVFFLPDDGKLTQPYAKNLQDLGVEVMHASNKDDLFKLLNDKADTFNYAWISRPALNARYQQILNSNTKKIFDTVDLHYVRMLRQAEKETSKKLASRAEKTKRLELKLATFSDATITVTEKEKEILINEGIENVFVIPNIHASHGNYGQPDFDQRKGILFIGGYKHDPNIDAARWLVNEIMPGIWEKDPSIFLTLLGSDPTEEILKFRSSNVFVPGYVADVSSFFIAHKVFIAPLRYGAGMKGKIGQSLEFGLPVVSTDVGVEGMDLQDGQNVLVANTANQFIDKVLLLYNSKVLWQQIRDKSVEAINDYTPESVTDKLRFLFDKIDD